MSVPKGKGRMNLTIPLLCDILTLHSGSGIFFTKTRALSNRRKLHRSLSADERSPFYWRFSMLKGEKHTKESKELLRIHHRGSGMKGKHHTPQARENIRKSQLGEKNHNWSGGKITERQKGINDWKWREARIKCLERDNYTCQKCGVKKQLCAHHIIPYGKVIDDTIENLITLCESCHMKIHGSANQNLRNANNV